MENPQGPDSKAAASGGSGRTTPGGSWQNGSGAAAAGQPGSDDVSRLARAALFAGNGGTDAAAAAAAAAGGLLDPLSAQQLTPEQLSAMLGNGGYTATALSSLGGTADAAALNALLLGGGINLNQLSAQSLQLAGLGDFSTLNALVGGDAGADMDDHAGGGAGGGGGKGGGLNVTSNKQLSSRFRCVFCVWFWESAWVRAGVQQGLS